MIAPALNGKTIASVLDVLCSVGESALESELVASVLDPSDLGVLRRRYKRFPDATYEGTHLEFLTWLLLNVGPRLPMSDRDLEFLLPPFNAEGGVSTRLVCPNWLLSLPIAGALQQRLPCRPLVPGRSRDLQLAYDGLLEHLPLVVPLGDHAAPGEVAVSAIPWRIVAIADLLEAPNGTEGMNARLGRLRFRTVGHLEKTDSDLHLWRHLNTDFVSRRNGLSHAGVDQWSFTRCVTPPMASGEMLEATAAICLAVTKEIGRSIRDESAPRSLLEAVERETEWIDDSVAA